MGGLEPAVNVLEAKDEARRRVLRSARQTAGTARRGVWCGQGVPGAFGGGRRGGAGGVARRRAGGPDGPGGPAGRRGADRAPTELRQSPTVLTVPTVRAQVFCYLESELDTLKTAGLSRRDLYSHLNPIIFTSHSTPMWCPNCEQNGRLIRLMNSDSERRTVRTRYTYWALPYSTAQVRRVICSHGTETHYG